MCDGSGKVNVSHALASNGSACDFDFALIAYESFASHAHISLSLVLPAVALKIACWSENALAEEAVAFRAQGAVVDGFGFFHLSP